MSGKVVAIRPGHTPYDREVSGPPPEDGGGGGPPEAPPPPDEGGFDFGDVVPLGLTTRRERTCCVFLDASGRKVVLDARALHQRSSLDMLFGGSQAHQFLIDRWPLVAMKRGKAQPASDWDPERLGSALMSACQAVGDADAVHLLLDGVWPHGEGVLFHAGDRILTYGAEAEEHRPGWRDGKSIYIATGKRARPAPAAATVAQVEALMRDLTLWRYAAPEAGPKLLMGVLFSGLMAAPQRWRPHCIIRGVTNAGKSSLVNLLAAAAGCGAPLKALTQGALYRGYNARSGLIALDEQEAQSEDVARMVAIMRGASDGEGAVKMQVGEGGTNVTFRVTGTFLLGAISPPPLNDADESRITLIHILRPDVDRRAEVEAAQEAAAALHPALLRRAIEAWPRYQAAWRVARAAAAGHDATSRSADQLGALVAGWWVMAHDAPLGEAEADEEVGALLPFLTTRTAAAEADTAMLALQHLLASRIPMKERSSDQISVMAALTKAYRAQHRLLSKGPADVSGDWQRDVDFWRLQLGSCGMAFNAFGFTGRGWPWPFDGPPVRGLLIADSHPMPEQLFKGTVWQARAWQSPLLDLPGARKGKAAKFPHGGTHRARFVPLAHLGLSDEDAFDVEA